MRYELDGDVWTICQAGAQLEIVSGGKKTVRKFQKPEQAAAQLEKLVAERVAAGYQPAHHDPRYPELEAVIAADPDNPAHYAVLGDWLQSRGDPRGQLIALELADDKAARKFLGKHLDEFLGPLAPYEKASPEPLFTWRFGFIQQAYLHGERQKPLDGVLELVLAAPVGRFLVNLTLGHADQAVVAVLSQRAPASLRALRLWRIENLDLGAVWERVPSLRRLSLSGRALALGGLELPALERLELTDEHMLHATTRTIARQAWPALRELRLDFGHAELTGDASIDDVFALLARRDLGALVNLALVHTRYANELVRELAASPIAAQLTHLDLTHNRMTDRHALALAPLRPHFPELVHLDVSANELTPFGLNALREFPLR
jgi:uncharacterized protein (TIGR02996 family)